MGYVLGCLANGDREPSKVTWKPISAEAKRPRKGQTGVKSRFKDCPQCPRDPSTVSEQQGRPPGHRTAA